MARIFKVPFATQGDKSVIPEPTQGDGSVSLTQGFGFDYQREYEDPESKDIQREVMNGIFHDITQAIGEIQTSGIAAWGVEAAPYAIRAFVRHNDQIWVSRVNNNNVEPVEGANWETLATFINRAHTVTITDWNETPDYDCFLYAASSETLNRPPGVATYGWQLSNPEGSRKHQFATGVSTGSIYWRRNFAGVWDTEWQEFFHSGNQLALGETADSAQTALELIPQNDASDSTAGRLMTVGAFGLGGNLRLLEENLDDVITTGLYGQHVNAFATFERNYPVLECGSLIVVQGNGNGILTQIYMGYGGTTLAGNMQRMFIRAKTGVTWSDWREIYHSGNIAQAFQTLKSPNGYRILPDGTIEQWGAVTATIAGASFNFPVAFPTACWRITAGPSNGSIPGAISMSTPTLIGGVAYTDLGAPGCIVHYRAVGQ